MLKEGAHQSRRGAAWQLYVRGADGRTVGSAVVVSPQHAVTCAHVVNAALGLPQSDEDFPGHGKTVGVAAPHFDDGWQTRATVLANGWFRGSAPWDIAVLELREPAPMPPAVPRRRSRQPGQEAMVLGYPDAPFGTWSRVRLLLEGGPYPDTVQMNLSEPVDIRITPGFSGSAVRDAQGHLLGIVCHSHWDRDPLGAGQDRLGTTSWMLPMEIIPAVWREPAAARTPHADLVTALSLVRQVADARCREELRGFFSAREWERVRGVSAARTLADHLVSRFRERRELRTFLRWLHYRDLGSARAGQLWRAAEPLLKEEEIALFEDAGDTERIPSEQLRLLLQAVPFDDVRDAYGQASRERLESGRHAPLDAWDALVDLCDLPPGSDGRAPATVFAARVARHTPDGALALALRDWLPGPESAPEVEPESAAEPETEPVPARLIIELSRRGIWRRRFRAVHRTKLKAARTTDPTYSGPTTARIHPDRLQEYVVSLLREVEANARRGNHRSVRLEMVLPEDLLDAFAFARWELTMPGVVEPPRLGVKYEIIIRSAEFLEPKKFRKPKTGAYHSARASYEKRAELLRNNGHGLLTNRDGLNVTEGRRLSESLLDQRIAVYLLPPSQDQTWQQEVMSAVYSGVPVIAWSQSTETDIGPYFTQLLAPGDDGRVSTENITQLTENLRRLRARELSTGPDCDPEGGFDLCVLLCDLSDTPSHSGLSTSRAG